MKLTYKQIPDAIRDFKTFKGNSVSTRTSRLCNTYNIYKVYSYGTTILEYNINTKDIIYFDNDYHSTATSKLQNILIDIFNLNDGKKKRD